MKFDLLQLLQNELDLIDNELENLEEIRKDLLDSDKKKTRGGSTVGRRYIDRDHIQGHRRLYNDYFSLNPVYTDKQFRRRFRMRRSLFLRIVEDVKDKNPYFRQRRDAAQRLGLSPLQKITAAIRQLAYGISSDCVDEYIRIGESTAMECLKRFCHTIVEIYEDEYLRTPNEQDMERLLKEGESRGFPGMLGSIDCMHWVWKNCPKAWHGQYTGKEKMPTVILEAVASYDLWIWHAFFGLPGALNDINVLDRSHVFDDLMNGRTPEVEFVINGNKYNKGYYLADGIYPAFSTFVKTISEPQSEMKKVYYIKQI